MNKVSRGTATVTVALLGALVLLSTLPTWVRGTTPTATGDLLVSAAGTTASPTAASIGLVIIAAGLLLGLAGRGARIAALAAVMGGSALALATIVGFLREPEAVARAAAATVTSVRAINLPVTVTLWPYLSILVLVFAFAAAAWFVTHLGSWAGVGRRYETAVEQASEPRPEAQVDPQVSARLRAMDDWDAITRGEDPS